MFAEMTRDVFDVFGLPAVYRSAALVEGATGEPVSTLAILDIESADDVGNYVEVSEEETLIDLMREDVGLPERGAQIEIVDGDHYRVERRVSSDLYRVRLLVTEVAS